MCSQPLRCVSTLPPILTASFCRPCSCHDPDINFTFCWNTMIYASDIKHAEHTYSSQAVMVQSQNKRERFYNNQAPVIGRGSVLHCIELQPKSERLLGATAKSLGEILASLPASSRSLGRLSLLSSLYLINQPPLLADHHLPCLFWASPPAG